MKLLQKTKGQKQNTQKKTGFSKTHTVSKQKKPLVVHQKKPLVVQHKKSAPSASSDDDSDSDASEIQVKFEFFNTSPSDYHSIKQYLGNLFGIGDHGVELVPLTAFLCEVVAEHLGTCIKTDGEESDPFGILTGFPLAFLDNNPENTHISSFLKFLTQKLPEFDAKAFFANDRNVLLFQERLINVPAALAPPLFRQFLDDWEAACRDEKHGKCFIEPNEVLLITSTYREVESKLDREMGLASKQPKKDSSAFSISSSAINYYYPEAEFLSKFAKSSHCFSVNTGHESSDSRRAFSDVGIESARQLFILTWPKFLEYVQFLERYDESELESF